MIFGLLAVLLAQPTLGGGAQSVTVTNPTNPAKRVTTTTGAGKESLDVNCVSGCSGSSGGGGGGGTIDGGFVGVSSLPLVFIQDAGVLNVNFPASQTVNGTVTALQGPGQDGGLWQTGVVSMPVLFIQDAGVLNVNFPASQTVNGSVSVSNFPATQPVSGTVTVIQGTGTNLHAVLDATSTTAVTQATAANLNATVVQATAANLNVTAAQGGSWTVTTSPPSNASTNVAQWGGSATALGQTAMASSVPVVLASNQSTLAVSAGSLPLPAGASTDSTLSGLLDGGVGLLSTIATNQTSGSERVTVIMMQYPLNPFLPRCNPVRRTGCQP